MSRRLRFDLVAIMASSLLHGCPKAAEEGAAGLFDRFARYRRRMEEPPDDPEEWSPEQWIEWLNATRPEPDDEPTLRRVRRSWGTGPAVLGAGMLGLEQAIFGPVDEPDIVVVADADGHDDDDEISLDFVAGDPKATSIELGEQGERGDRQQ